MTDDRASSVLSPVEQAPIVCSRLKVRYLRGLSGETVDLNETKDISTEVNLSQGVLAVLKKGAQSLKMTELKAATKTTPNLPQSRLPKKQIALAALAVICKATLDSTTIVDSQEKKPSLYSTTFSDRPLEKLALLNAIMNCLLTNWGEALANPSPWGEGS